MCFHKDRKFSSPFRFSFPNTLLAKSTIPLKTDLIKQRRYICGAGLENLFILGLLIMLPVTLWVTDNLQKTLSDVPWLVAGIGAFCLISSLCVSMLMVRRLAALSVLAGLLIIVFVPAYVTWNLRPQSAFLLDVYRNFPKIENLSAHPNTLAVGLLAFLPLLIGLLFFGAREMSTLEWVFTGVVVLLGMGFLLFTQSVGGWIGFIVAFLLLVLLRWRRIGLLMILVIGGVLAYFLVMGLPPVLQTFSVHEIIEPLKMRSEMWARAIYLIRKFPITGIGMGTYEQKVDSLYPIINYPPENIPHIRPHNVYLQVGVDLGLPGLAAWLFLLIYALFAARQIYCAGRVRSAPWLIGLGAGLLCSQAGLMIHGLVDNVFPAFWPIWGFTVGCRNLLFGREVGFRRDFQQSAVGSE